MLSFSPRNNTCYLSFCCVGFRRTMEEILSLFSAKMKSVAIVLLKAIFIKDNRYFFKAMNVHDFHRVRLADKTLASQLEQQCYDGNCCQLDIFLFNGLNRPVICVLLYVFYLVLVHLACGILTALSRLCVCSSTFLLCSSQVAFQ